ALITCPSLPVRDLVGGLAAGDYVDLELGVRCRHAGFRKTQFTPNDVAALRDGAGFVERDLAIAALAAEAAVARYHQAIGRDELECFPDLAGDVLGTVGLQDAMAYGADGDLLFQIMLERLKEVEIPLIAIFHL